MHHRPLLRSVASRSFLQIEHYNNLFSLATSIYTLGLLARWKLGGEREEKSREKVKDLPLSLALPVSDRALLAWDARAKHL